MKTGLVIVANVINLSAPWSICIFRSGFARVWGQQVPRGALPSAGILASSASEDI